MSRDTVDRYQLQGDRNLEVVVVDVEAKSWYTADDETKYRKRSERVGDARFFS